MTSVPLEDLLVDGQVSYGVVQPGTDDPSGVPIIRVKDIRNGVIDTSAPMRVAQEISARHSRTLLRGGELVLSLVGTVGEAAVVPYSLAGWNVARAVAVLRSEKVTAQWLQLAFESPTCQSQINSLLNTTVQSTLNLSDLKRVRVPTPPLSEQIAIAEVLGALDDKININAELAASSFALATQLFRQSLAVGQSNEKALGSTATVVLGGTPSRDEPAFWANGTVAWLNSGKANDDRILTPTEMITEDALRKSAAKLMPRSATVVAITGATLGQVSRLEIEAAGNQSLVGIWADDAGLTDWLHFAVRHRTTELLRHATGAAQQHVSKGDVEALAVPVPDEATLHGFARRASPLLAAAASADRESLSLAATRDALLPRLMSGKLRVRGAEKLAAEVGA
ncbi:restriction endonuclease subunit S [Homoserinimonas sp. A447]